MCRWYKVTFSWIYAEYKITSKYYDVLILCLQPQGKGISCLAIYYILASTFGLWNNNEKIVWNRVTVFLLEYGSMILGQHLKILFLKIELHVAIVNQGCIVYCRQTMIKRHSKKRQNRIFRMHPIAIDKAIVHTPSANLCSLGKLVKLTRCQHPWTLSTNSVLVHFCMV